MKKTKYILPVLLMLFSSYSNYSLAQAPSKIPYQTIVRNVGGNLVLNSPVGVKFTILEDFINGPSVYEETHASTTTNTGLLNLEIGSGIVVGGSLGNLSLHNHIYFLKVEVDPLGGTAYSISATSQLNSVPYAWHARTSGDWLRNGVNLSNLNSGNVGIGTNTPTAKLDVAGSTKTQNLQITNGASANKVLVGDALGNASWANAPGSIASALYFDGSVGAITDNTTYQFLGTTATITVTAGQKVEVTASAGLGTTNPTGAQFNRVSIGYQINSTGNILDGGADWSAYKLLNGQRDLLTLNTIFSSLPPGTHKVGMIYITATGNAAFFNQNDWSRITVKIINP